MSHFLQILYLVLYPELRQVALAERVDALATARATPFDVLELFGMAAGVVLVTALTRYAGGELDANQRFAVGTLNFLVALPMLALAVGPFFIRRIRRGLRAALSPEVTRTSRETLRSSAAPPSTPPAAAPKTDAG